MQWHTKTRNGEMTLIVATHLPAGQVFSDVVASGGLAPDPVLAAQNACVESAESRHAMPRDA